MKQTKVYVAFLIPLTACTMVLLLLTISEWKETFHLNTSKEENSNKSIPILCADPDWCNIEMPSDSLFRFPAPTNRTLWRLAQVHAWRGDQILLQKSIEAIKTPMEFLVGDINFREYHSMFDYFLDPQHDFSFLTHQNRTTPPYKSAIPRAYLAKNRAALVSASYVVTEKRKGQHSAPFFFGLKQRMQYLYLDHILAQWKYWKNAIKKSFVLMSSFDENWGLLSTVFPGRTGDWSRCCSPRVYGLLREMLSDDKLVMMLINQHHNFTHPKLVTLPRGLPIYGENQRRLLWNTMISRVHRQKSLWIFTASSSWGHRPGIAKCILNNIGNHSDVVMELHGRDLKGRSGERAYYPRLSSARISIALPGIGYETFRLWESMTLGVLPVVEKGVGLDKMLWKLPVLLVEDFSLVTPSLLRTAYVEALYRALAGHFDWQRLTQSFWWNFIFTVASAQSSERILDFFPAEAEDRSFARPLEPFACARTGSCGPGTLRTPRSSCIFDHVYKSKHKRST